MLQTLTDNKHEYDPKLSLIFQKKNKQQLIQAVMNTGLFYLIYSSYKDALLCIGVYALKIAVTQNRC